MFQIIALVENSFKITGRGIIVDLKHTEDGLTKGTKLISQESRLIWEVDVRVLFDHAVKDQMIFESESLNIFQYLIKPIGHDNKPMEGEKLIKTT